MAASSGERAFYRRFDLRAERENPPKKQPAAHQSEALTALTTWYERKHTPAAGALLVLPTGRWQDVHRSPVPESRSTVRRVQGPMACPHASPPGAGVRGDAGERGSDPRAPPSARGAGRVRDAWPLPGALHRVRRRRDHRHPSDRSSELGGRITRHWRGLPVVTGEAVRRFRRSAPRACSELPPTHARPAQALPQCSMVGLTATPTYTQEAQRGWLAEIFPQGICYQVSPQRVDGSGDPRPARHRGGPNRGCRGVR